MKNIILICLCFSVFSCKDNNSSAEATSTTSVKEIDKEEIKKLIEEKLSGKLPVKSLKVCWIKDGVGAIINEGTAFWIKDGVVYCANGMAIGLVRVSSAVKCETSPAGADYLDIEKLAK